MNVDIVSFLLGVLFMGVTVMTACIVFMRQENKLKKYKLTPPDTLEFELPYSVKLPEEGQSFWTRSVEYVVDGVYGRKIFLKLKGSP